MQSFEITKNQINLYLIKIIQFCLKIYDLLRHPHLRVDAWVDVSVHGWVCVKITKCFALIKIIQFCLYIMDMSLCTHHSLESVMSN